MDSSGTGAVLVTCLVLTAGCNAFGEGTPNADRDPYDVPPGTTTTRASPSAADLVPEQASGEVHTAFTLAGFHRDTLDGRAFRVRRTLTVRRPNGTLVYARMAHASVAANGTRYRLGVRLNESWGMTETRVWSAGEGAPTLVAQTMGIRDAYGALGGDGDPGSLGVDSFGIDPTFRDAIYRYLGAVAGAEVTPTSNRTDSRGYLVRATAFENEPFVGDVGRRPASNVSLRAVVDGRGFVESVDVEYATTFDGRPVRVTDEIRFSQLGNLTVDPPPWRDLARKRAGLANGSTPPSVVGAADDPRWVAPPTPGTPPAVTLARPRSPRPRHAPRTAEVTPRRRPDRGSIPSSSRVGRRQALP